MPTAAEAHSRGEARAEEPTDPRGFEEAERNVNRTPGVHAHPRPTAIISLIAYVLTKISVTIAAGGIVFEALMGVDFWTGALVVGIATGQLLEIRK